MLIKVIAVIVTVLMGIIHRQWHVSRQILRSWWEIEQRLLSEEFLFRCRSHTRFSRLQAEQFYSEHKVNQLAWQRVNAAQYLDYCVHGRTIHKAPDTIRGTFGLTDTRNCTHGSDSETSAAREIATFFPDFSIERFHNMETDFRHGIVKYDVDTGTHKLCS